MDEKIITPHDRSVLALIASNNSISRKDTERLIGGLSTNGEEIAIAILKEKRTKGFVRKTVSTYAVRTARSLIKASN